MDTKNEDDAKNAGNGNPNPNPKADAQKSKMDINRYLQKAKYGKSIADMLRVLFKGKMATETEWAAKVNEVINRKAV